MIAEAFLIAVALLALKLLIITPLVLLYRRWRPARVTAVAVDARLTAIRDSVVGVLEELARLAEKHDDQLRLVDSSLLGKKTESLSRGRRPCLRAKPLGLDQNQQEDSGLGIPLKTDLRVPAGMLLALGADNRLVVAVPGKGIQVWRALADTDGMRWMRINDEEWRP